MSARAAAAPLLTVAAICAICILVQRPLGLDVFQPLSDTAAAWQRLMERAEAEVQEAGYLGPLYFLALYTASSVLCLPLFGFHAVAGYTYGTLRGALLVSVCQTFGAGAAFLFARHFVRPTARSYLERKWGALFRSVDRAVAKQGLKIVFLIRASPVLPFSVTNYLCGVTQLGLDTFILATWVPRNPFPLSRIAAACSVAVAPPAGGRTAGHDHILLHRRGGQASDGGRADAGAELPDGLWHLGGAAGDQDDLGHRHPRPGGGRGRRAAASSATSGGAERARERSEPEPQPQPRFAVARATEAKIALIDARGGLNNYQLSLRPELIGQGGSRGPPRSSGAARLSAQRSVRRASPRAAACASRPSSPPWPRPRPRPRLAVWA